MTPRTLKILLAVSVALNLFAVGAGASALMTRKSVEREVEAQHRPGRGGPAMGLVADLDPAVREGVREKLRASALTAKPDFEAARTARREAVALAAAEPIDPAAIQALLEQSRLAEMRGRARLETGAIGILAELKPEDRAVLAPILARTGSHGRGERRAEKLPAE